MIYSKTINKIIPYIKNIYEFLSGLWLEGNSKKISIGRIMLITLLYCSYNRFWIKGLDIPKNLFYIIAFLILYNFSKKLGLIGDFVAKCKGLKNE